MEQISLVFFFFMLLACTSMVVECIMSIYILSGQSNMVGEGGVINGVWDGIVPPECQSNPQILRLNNASQWEVAREPLHHDLSPSQPCGVGPGMPFANSILKPGEIIGLVPCAVGATHIDHWQRGQGLYQHMLTRAQAQAAVSNGGGVIRAILWYQGESDTYDIGHADAYKGNLTQLFNDLRNDLHSPSLPIIQVALVNGGNYTDKVREVQLNTGLPNVYSVDARTLNVTIQSYEPASRHPKPSEARQSASLCLP